MIREVDMRCACIDSDDEPVPGLPEDVPNGERILWQGKPSTKTVFTQFLKGWVANSLIALLVVGAAIFMMFPEASTTVVAKGAVFTTAPIAILLLLYPLFAFASAKNTIYTVTNRRLGLRTGFLIGRSINIPFETVQSASVQHNDNDTLDISVTLRRDSQIGYFVLWPNVAMTLRGQVRPSLRSLSSKTSAACYLAKALANFNQQPVFNQQTEAASQSAKQPANQSPTNHKPEDPAPHFASVGS